MHTLCGQAPRCEHYSHVTLPESLQLYTHLGWPRPFLPPKLRPYDKCSGCIFIFDGDRSIGDVELNIVIDTGEGHGKGLSVLQYGVLENGNVPAGQLLGNSGIGGELDGSCEAAVVGTGWREGGREGGREE